MAAGRTATTRCEVAVNAHIDAFVTPRVRLLARRSHLELKWRHKMLLSGASAALRTVRTAPRIARHATSTARPAPAATRRLVVFSAGGAVIGFAGAARSQRGPSKRAQQTVDASRRRRGDEFSGGEAAATSFRVAPRTVRDSSPLNVHVAAAASPRLVSTEDLRGGRGAAATRLWKFRARGRQSRRRARGQAETLAGRRALGQGELRRL